jgi:CheY-like chemotaxis protein
VTNLVTNASKYSDAHSTIGVKVEQIGDTARLIVSDVGIGIPPDRLHEIFEVFVQIDPSIERRQGGLGIGLALVKSLAELHGGTVSARSDGIGTGSEFVVELPALPERRGVPRTDAHKPRDLQKRRVLVIDDNEDAADSLAALLAGMGHEVTTLYTGDTAVEEVARQSPEVVLCDIGMPGVSGLDVARQLRSVFKDRRLMLIAATGYGRPEDAALAKAAGFDVHLVKPIDLDRLQAAIAAR